MSGSGPRRRKKLPHEIPSWVRQGARHFITVNHAQRGEDLLCRGTVPQALLEGGRVYDRLGRWYLWLLLIMPDHLHLIATFDLQRGIRPTMKAWKAYHAGRLGIDWQADFFEHRLRNEKELEEKARYIRMNPVRKGLVSTPEQWPHVLDRTQLDQPEKGTKP